MLLTEPDFPPGVQYDRIVEEPTQPDGAGGPPPMLSKPPGCAERADQRDRRRRPNAVRAAPLNYSVIYDGARIVMTVLSWQLDLDRARRDRQPVCNASRRSSIRSPTGIPMTTTKLPAGDG